MKALIIDDNHSFIDLLKNALLPFRMQIDSYYKFSEARSALLKQGCYFNQSAATEILKYHEAITKGNGKSIPPMPVLEKPVINSDGYGIIFLEYDTEPSMKGTHFIQDILKNQREWAEKNFMLLTSQPDKIEPIAKKMKIVLIEKPIKKDQLLKVVNDFIQSIAQKEHEIKELVALYGIKVRTSDEKQKARKSATTKKKKSVKQKSR